MIIIHGYELDGGGACPEQYNVTKDGKSVGYIRLRGGWFTASVPGPEDPGWTESAEIFCYPFQDDWKGDFTDEERLPWLTAATKAIHNFINRGGVNTLPSLPIKENET